MGGSQEPSVSAPTARWTWGMEDVMKLVACIVLVGAIAVLAPPAAAEEPQTPEILATLFPATGFIPVGSERRVYTFEASAIDPDDPHKGKAHATTLLEPGQTREVSSGRGKEWQIEGTVTLKENGHVMYHLTLLHNGKRVTSASAGLRLENDD
jgi:hypothetical protein